MKKQGSSKLNCLFEAYCEANRAFEADPSATNEILLEIVKTDLFTDVLDYAKRSIGKINRSRQWVSVESMMEDLAQDTARRVWEYLPTFKSNCMFSTWVFQISQSVALDAMKAVSRNREVRLLQWKTYDTDLDTHATTCGALDAAMDRDHVEGECTDNSPISNSDDYSGGGDTGSGWGRRPMLSQFYLHREENFLAGEMDLAGLISRLHGYDLCVFVQLAVFKESAREVAEYLEWFRQDGKPDTRRVENRYRKVLKKIRRGA